MEKKPRIAMTLEAYLLEQVARKNITVDEAVKLLAAIRETKEEDDGRDISPGLV